MSDEMRDRGVFELHFNTHLQAIVRYAQRRLAGNDAVWDVVAETFTVAWRRRATAPTEPDEVLPWLYAIAGNVTRNTQRAQLRRDKLGRRSPSPAGASTDANQEADARLDAEQRLSRALAQVSDDDREILRLVAWENLDLAGAAVALGISYGAAKVRLHRARRRLRELLPDDPSLSSPGPQCPAGSSVVSYGSQADMRRSRRT